MRLFLPFTTAVVLTAISAISFARGAEVGAAYLTIESRGGADRGGGTEAGDESARTAGKG